MLQGSILSGASLVAVMIATFLALYFLMLKWWRPSNRVQQSVRTGLWAVAITAPFMVGPVLGMEAERAARGVTILIPAFFLIGAFVGGIYSVTPFYKPKERDNS